MTDITPISAASSAAVAASRPAAQQGDGAMIGSDFETFLRMLTAQLENQDPLNPLESTDFAVQLATFSGVEQQVRTNELLQSLELVMGGANLSQLAGWIGLDAEVEAPVGFTGAPIDLTLAPAPGAMRAELIVRDADGTVWDRQRVPVAPGPFEWSGRRTDGSAFQEATYNFELVSYDAAGEEIAASVPKAYARIVEARNGADGPDLVMVGGTVVPAVDVSALRTP